MATIAAFSRRNILQLQDEARTSLKDCASLAAAAQRLTDCLWGTFSDSLVLVRCFATIPFSRLPPANQAFVGRVAAAKGAEGMIRENTRVLSLLGTRGVQPEWNDRGASRGHVGIPLISADFIESIPMVARLLRELEVDFGWFDASDREFVETRLGAGQVGVFFVEDARTARDAQGRAIISAQDFVEENGVRTVFGLGGIYGDGTVLVILLFTREALDKTVVDEYTHLVPLIKAATGDLIREGALFEVSS